MLITIVAEAAARRGIGPREVSFSGALQTFDAFCPLLLLASGPTVRSELWQSMVAAISSHRVGQCPNRVEPRAIKRRSKTQAADHPSQTSPNAIAERNL